MNNSSKDINHVKLYNELLACHKRARMIPSPPAAVIKVKLFLEWDNGTRIIMLI